MEILSQMSTVKVMVRKLLAYFLSRDAMHLRGLCCRLVSVSVHLSRSRIVSRRLEISSNFFLGPVAPSF